VLNSVKDNRERIGRMLQMHANHREDIKEARAGDIVALAGLKNTTTVRHAVRSEQSGRAGAHGVPRAGHRDRGRAEDQGRPGEDGPGAGASRHEDPSFRVAVDHESGQTIIKGMGELHLEIIVDRMRREFKVDANVGAPQVAYRETITRTSEVDYTHKKQTGGSGQFARVKMPLRAATGGVGLPVQERGRRRHRAEEYIPGVEKGIKGSVETGVLAGFPVIDFKAVAVRRRLPRR